MKKTKTHMKRSTTVIGIHRRMEIIQFKEIVEKERMKEVQ